MNNLQFNCGELSITHGPTITIKNYNDEFSVSVEPPLTLGSGIVEFTDIPISAREIRPMHYHLGNSAQFTGSIDNINLELLNQMSYPVDPYNFTLVYYIPIMIQARWHKKARVNKKWQKRYGMKEDSVRVEADAKTIEYNGDDYRDRKSVV